MDQYSDRKKTFRGEKKKQEKKQEKKPGSHTYTTSSLEPAG
jgi:hypothetical protein